MKHAPMHVVDDALPTQAGYTIRTHAIVRVQRALGMAPAVVVRPTHKLVPCDKVLANGVDVARYRPLLHKDAVLVRPRRATPSVVHPGLDQWR